MSRIDTRLVTIRFLGQNLVLTVNQWEDLSAMLRDPVAATYEANRIDERLQGLRA